MSELAGNIGLREIGTTDNSVGVEIQKEIGIYGFDKILDRLLAHCKKTKNSLLNEVTFRVDQRDALQQELYCLKEDRNDLYRRFQTMLKQIQSLGLDAKSIQLVCIN